MLMKWAFSVLTQQIFEQQQTDWRHSRHLDAADKNGYFLS
jgi:hypothetical protein